MGQWYVFLQLVILMGLLVMGLYVIFTDEMLIPEEKKIEEEVKAAEPILTEEMPEIHFVQVICTSCCLAGVEGESATLGENTEDYRVPIEEERLQAEENLSMT